MIDAFREKDKNLDGLMSYEEFVGHESRIELAFKALDTNGDGFVSRSEFKKICPNMTREQVEAAFNKFDKDQTGRINYAEFCSMLNKNKWANIIRTRRLSFFPFVTMRVKFAVAIRPRLLPLQMQSHFKDFSLYILP